MDRQVPFPCIRRKTGAKAVPESTEENERPVPGLPRPVTLFAPPEHLYVAMEAGRTADAHLSRGLGARRAQGPTSR